MAKILTCSATLVPPCQEVTPLLFLRVLSHLLLLENLQLSVLLIRKEVGLLLVITILLAKLLPKRPHHDVPSFILNLF